MTLSNFPPFVSLNIISDGLTNRLLIGQLLYNHNVNPGYLCSRYHPLSLPQVVQVYLSWRTNETMPHLQLAAFDRLHLRSGESREFRFTIDARQMAVWTDTQGFVVQPGRNYSFHFSIVCPFTLVYYKNFF